jgi:hypothetical protein
MNLACLPRTIAPGVILLAFASGCASLPAPAAAPNGQPLSVREHTETAHYTVKEKIGEVEHKNDKGEKIGTSEVYQNRLQTVHYQVWNSYQGDTKISDDDLYRISKDEKAARDVQSGRETGVLLNRIGIGTFIAGAAAAGAGYYMVTQVKEGDSPVVPSALLYGGLITASVGGLLAYLGLHKANVEHPLDQTRAMQAADNYNRGLAGGTTTTTGASFRR